jgi:inosose dehydratase
MNKPFQVKIGINPISWCNDDLPAGRRSDAGHHLREGARIGYQGFELGNKFPRDPQALAAVLQPCGVSACPAGIPVIWPRAAWKRIRRVEPHLQLLVQNGCKVMVYGEVASAIQGQPQPLWPSARALAASSSGWPMARG